MASARGFDQRRDDASMLLGMAYGVAHMCCGAAEEVVDTEASDVTDIVAGLRHIAELVGEANGLVASIAGPAEHVARALSVLTLATNDIGVEREGRYFQHWNDEITAWSLHAVCDLVKRAKAAVDGEAVPAGEIAHA